TFERYGSGLFHAVTLKEQEGASVNESATCLRGRPFLDRRVRRRYLRRTNRRAVVIRTKSVHSPIEPELDGLRILATRLRGRGLPTSRYDVWMANLGPSQSLLEAIQSGRIRWSEFARRYRG